MPSTVFITTHIICIPYLLTKHTAAHLFSDMLHLAHELEQRWLPSTATHVKCGLMVPLNGKSTEVVESIERIPKKVPLSSFQKVPLSSLNKRRCSKMQWRYSCFLYIVAVCYDAGCDNQKKKARIILYDQHADRDQAQSQVFSRSYACRSSPGEVGLDSVSTG